VRISGEVRTLYNGLSLGAIAKRDASEVLGARHRRSGICRAMAGSEDGYHLESRIDSTETP
jgi:hypothetical protein